MKSNIIKLGVCLLATLAMFSCKKQETSAYSANPTSITLHVGETTTVTADVYGVKSAEGTPVSGVTWSSSDTYVADVDANGLVTAKKVGVAIVSGSFQNGKSVFCEIYVDGRSQLFNEPMIGKSMAEVISDVEMSGDSIVRTGENYIVVYDKLEVYKHSDYTFYGFGTKGCALVDIQGDAAHDELIKTFVPERYDSKGEYFVNSSNVRIYTSTPYEYAAIYTADNNAATTAEAVAAYKASGVSFIDKAANPASYSKEALDLVNDITYEAVDKTAVNNIVNAGKQTVATSKIIKDIEEVLSNDRAALETEFVKAARVSGLNICHSNLSAPYDENNFYPAAWTEIQKLDLAASEAFNAAQTIKQVDAAITNNKALYSTIVSKSVVDLYKNDLTKAYQKYNESDYTAENWTTLTGYYNAGLSDLETSITTKEAETKNKEVKAQMKAVPKK